MRKQEALLTASMSHSLTWVPMISACESTAKLYVRQGSVKDDSEPVKPRLVKISGWVTTALHVGKAEERGKRETGDDKHRVIGGYAYRTCFFSSQAPRERQMAEVLWTSHGFLIKLPRTPASMPDP